MLALAVAVPDVPSVLSAVEAPLLLPVPVLLVPVLLVPVLLVSVPLAPVPDCICICRSQFWKSASSEASPAVLVPAEVVLPAVEVPAVEVPAVEVPAVEVPAVVADPQVKSGSASVLKLPELPLEEDVEERKAFVQELLVTAPIDMGRVLAWWALPDPDAWSVPSRAIPERGAGAPLGLSARQDLPARSAASGRFRRSALIYFAGYPGGKISRGEGSARL